MATAYKIGRAESAAALCLLNEVDNDIYERLTGLVKCLGQDMLLLGSPPTDQLHEVIKFHFQTNADMYLTFFKKHVRYAIVIALPYCSRGFGLNWGF